MAERREDQDLAAEQFPDLNRQFYGTDFTPGDYLAHRLRALFLASGDPDLSQHAFDKPLDLAGIQIAFTEQDDLGEGARTNFLAVESTVVLHHAAEALVRLHFAHAGKPPCPWLEAARQRHPVFKLMPKLRELRRGLDQPATADALMEVFVGASRRPGSTATR